MEMDRSRLGGTKTTEMEASAEAGMMAVSLADEGWLGMGSKPVGRLSSRRGRCVGRCGSRGASTGLR